MKLKMLADMIFPIITLFTLFFSISLLIDKKVNKILNERLKGYNKLFENILEDTETGFGIKNQNFFLSALKGLDKKINNITDQVEKALFTLVLLKNFQSYAIGKTITEILEAPKVPNSLEINITFLVNLKEEYTYLKKGLARQLHKDEKNLDILQKNRINEIIKELDNLILVLSTISNESSAQYIEEIFKEVSASFVKIHGINNL